MRNVLTAVVLFTAMVSGCAVEMDDSGSVGSSLRARTPQYDDRELVGSQCYPGSPAVGGYQSVYIARYSDGWCNYFFYDTTNCQGIVVEADGSWTEHIIYGYEQPCPATE